MRLIKRLKFENVVTEVDIDIDLLIIACYRLIFSLFNQSSITDTVTKRIIESRKVSISLFNAGESRVIELNSYSR